MLEKMPPPEKIYEAWSALADGRVTLAENAGQNAGSAAAVSSNGEKTYRIDWQNGVFSSTDSASFWQGYPGYPVLAVLMLLGDLPFSAEDAKVFAGVNWNAANKKARGNYAGALAGVFASLGLAPAREEKLKKEARKTWEALRALDITLKRPPRGK